MTLGIDCTVQITDELAKALKAEGRTFVCRYFADPKYNWKCLTPEEAKVISDNGLQIVTVYEDSATDMQQGFARGVNDARNYLAMAKACGQPKGTAAYFAADFDATTADYDSIEGYLKGVKSILPQFIVRPYGEFDVIEEMVRRGVCDGGWQTIAWSGGKISQYARLLQYKNGENVAGISCDLDQSFGNEGWWNLLPKPPILPIIDGLASVVVKDDKLNELFDSKNSALLSKGVSYLPVRVIAQALGCEVFWDEKTMTITLIKQ